MEYRIIDLNKWHKTGGGANSDSYRCDDDNLMLKVFKHHATEETALRDFNMAKNVASLGITTAAVYEIVKIGAGVADLGEKASETFGVIYQNIKNKKSYSRLIADDPDNLSKYAKAFAIKAKELHSTPCNTELFEPRTEMIKRGIEKAKFVGKYKADLLELVAKMSECTTCLHGDLQTGNLINADGVDYWIDFDRFSYGDPRFDIAHMYNMFVSVSWLFYVQNLAHMNKKQLNEFWYAFAEEYYGYNRAEADEFGKTLSIFNALDLIQKNAITPGWFADLVTLILVRPKVKKYFK